MRGKSRNRPGYRVKLKRGAITGAWCLKHKKTIPPGKLLAYCLGRRNCPYTINTVKAKAM